MATPVTTGKLCTDVSQMIVGDIIKCVYESVAADQAGYFSQLGVLNPTMKVTTIRKNGEDDPNPEVTVTEEAYPELPTEPATYGSGYFYLIKVADGLLVADRMLQLQISWSSVNKKGYVYGNIFAVKSAATQKTITVTTTERTTQENDTSGTVTSSDNQFADSSKRYVTDTSTVTTVNDTNTKIVKTENRIDYAAMQSEPIQKDFVNVRLLSTDEFVKFLRNGTCDGAVTARNAAVWHYTVGDLAYYGQTLPIDMVENNTEANHYVCSSFPDAAPWHHNIPGGSGNTTWTVNINQKCDKTAIDAPSISGQSGPWGARWLSFPVCYRPAFEFIDNPKSTNLFY